MHLIPVMLDFCLEVTKYHSANFDQTRNSDVTEEHVASSEIYIDDERLSLSIALLPKLISK